MVILRYRCESCELDHLASDRNSPEYCPYCGEAGLLKDPPAQIDPKP